MTALHMCFGYAAIVHTQPNEYAYLTELADSTVQQISIEAAQPNLDLSVPERLPGKTIILDGARRAIDPWRENSMGWSAGWSGSRVHAGSCPAVH